MERETLSHNVYNEWVKLIQEIQKGEQIVHLFVSDKVNQEISDFQKAIEEFARKETGNNSYNFKQFVCYNLEDCDRMLNYYGGLEYLARDCDNLSDLLVKVGRETIYYSNYQKLVFEKETIARFLMLNNLFAIVEKGEGHIDILNNIFESIIHLDFSIITIEEIYIPKTYEEFRGAFL